MKTRTIVTSVLSIFVLGLAGLVIAGTEPSPFHQLINELDSVGNVLDAQDDQLKEYLMIPPDDIKPNALVNKLNSMAGTLVNQNERVSAVLASPPDDMTPPPEFIGALGEVGMKASSIVEKASSADPYTSEVEEALDNVESAADGIVTTVNDYIGSLPLPS